jgi:N-acetylglucosaminyldiphosphoundecaprenol N-acetyl-beta-D-mannosaminyltransferase
VNANTLNFAASEPGFREVLNSAEAIYADGTGVRWAARAQGIRLQENVNGTDFTPELFTRLSGNDFSYYLLGASPDSVAKAAAYARENFPGWQQAGFHHGYLDDEEVREEAIAEINAIQPDLLLVGMGNPIQERWIAEHRDQLNVGVCMGVGGLIDYWSGSIRRAHRLLRRCGYEWLGVMFLQPKKAKRYLLGNPMFLIRVALERLGWKKYGPIEAKPASDPHRSRDETAKSARIDSEKCNAQ